MNEYPFVRETWTGNDLGDVYLGAKVNLLSERLNQPLALALRGTVKVPTADDESGAGTGEWDYFADMVLSKEISRRSRSPASAASRSAATRRPSACQTGCDGAWAPPSAPARTFA